MLGPCWGHVGATPDDLLEFITFCCDVFQRDDDFGCFGLSAGFWGLIVLYSKALWRMAGQSHALGVEPKSVGCFLEL